MNKSLILIHTLGQIQRVLPKLLFNFSVFNQSVFIKVGVNGLRKVLYFFKTHLNLKFNYLKDICVVDFFLKKKNLFFYQIASITNNINLSFYFCAGKSTALRSVSDLFLGGN